MSKLVGVLVFFLIVSGVIGPARAQSPPSCEDQRRTLHVLIDAVTRARQRGEVEAAQAIAELLQKVETLQRDLEQIKMLKKKPE